MSPLSGEAPLAGATVRIYELDAYLADPAGAEAVATATTDGDGGYEAEGVPDGSDVVVVVDRDPRLTTIVHAVEPGATADVTSATTLAAEQAAAELAAGGSLPDGAFSEAVSRISEALDGETGSRLARVLERLVPETFGDGPPEDVAPGLRFFADVVAGADPALCEDLELGAESAPPATHLDVSGLAQGLGEEPFAWIYDAAGDSLSEDTRGPGVVRRTAAGATGGRLVAPVHPTSWMDGGPVAVVIRASEEAEATVRCPALDLQVEPLTPAPGAVEETVDAMVLDLRQAATNAGFDPDALLTADVHSLDPWIRGVAAYLQMLDGPDNPNSIRNMLSGDAPLLEAGAREHEELNEVFNAVMAHSGLLDELEGGVEVLTDAYAPFDGERPVGEAAPGRGGSSEDGPGEASPPDLPTPDPKPVTPETLDRLMTVESGIEEARTGPYGEYLEFSELAVGSIQTTLTLTGVGAPLAANLGIAGNAIAGMQIALEISQAMLPGNLDDIRIEASPTDYEEDRDDIGRWSADLAAHTGEWTLPWSSVVGAIPAAGPVLKVLRRAGVGTVGRDVAERVITHYQDQIGETLDAQDEGITLPRHQYFISGGISPDRAGEDDYFSWRISGDSFQLLVDETTYAPVQAGESQLAIQTESGRFGDQMRQSTEALTVHEINVRIRGPDGGTSPFFIEPGEVIGVRAEVENAIDTSVQWEWDDALEVVTLDGQDLVVRVPGQEGQYPVSAESMADEGPREGREPPRTGEAVIFAGTSFEVTPAPPCVETGQTVEFTATSGGEAVSFDEVDATVVSGPGTINASGEFIASDEGEVTIRFTYQPEGADEPETVEISFPVKEHCSYFAVESPQFSHTSYCLQGNGDLGWIQNDAFDEGFLIELVLSPLVLGQEGEWEKVLTFEDGWMIGLDPEPAPETDPSGWQGPDPQLGSTKLTLRKEIEQIDGQEVAVFSGSFSEVGVLNLYQTGATTVSGEFKGIVDMAHDPVPPGDLVCDITRQ